MALHRHFPGAPGSWSSARAAATADARRKPLPYRPQYRHQMWFSDSRYLVRRDGAWVYRIGLREGYSRKSLAGMASPPQALTAVRPLLCAALAEYGGPEMGLADHGGVFRAND